MESGKRNDRPQLAEALTDTKRQGVTLLIAKIDRLARNVAFIANLLESGVEVAAANMPEDNRFMLHMMAAVAEHEARAISERTKAALIAAKARGVKLGWDNPSRSRALHMHASMNGGMQTAKKADQFARNVLPLIKQIEARASSPREIPAELNARGIRTARGGVWQHVQVRNVLARVSSPPAPELPFAP